MNGLYEAALEVQRFMLEQDWRFCIIGGLAAVRWGQPRMTQDVDVSLLTERGSEEPYVDLLLNRFAARIPDARTFALDNRVVLASASNGLALDIVLAGFPYEERVITRASTFEFAPGVSLITASAEDVVLLKVFAGREHDWADVQGILVRQSARLDWPYITRELVSLCDLRGDDAPFKRLTDLRAQLDNE